MKTFSKIFILCSIEVIWNDIESE